MSKIKSCNLTLQVLWSTLCRVCALLRPFDITQKDQMLLIPPTRWLVIDFCYFYNHSAEGGVFYQSLNDRLYDKDNIELGVTFLLKATSTYVQLSCSVYIAFTSMLCGQNCYWCDAFGQAGSCVTKSYNIAGFDFDIKFEIAYVILMSK